MGLTKEECVNLYDLLFGEVCGCSCSCCVFDSSSCKFRKAKDSLKQLINEHFDNPPLEFGELEEFIGQHIWDNKIKEYTEEELETIELEEIER